MVKSKLKLAVFIEGIDKYKNILELVSRCLFFKSI